MEEQVLSEVPPGSDKTADGRAEFVRSPPRFGQNGRRKSRFCLKSPRVQTKQPMKEQNLSEVTPSSDKTAGERTEFVRSRQASIIEIFPNFSLPEKTSQYHLFFTTSRKIRLFNSYNLQNVHLILIAVNGVNL
jgi:hypothetical protein